MTIYNFEGFNLEPETLKFFRDYKAWLEAGAPDRNPFWRAYGLCANSACASGVISLLSHVFGEDEDVANFPFTSRHKLGREDGYYAEMHNDSSYLNPERRAFVDAVLEYYGDGK